MRIVKPLTQIYNYEEIGGGLYIPHTQECTINAKHIGKNVTIFQGGHNWKRK